MINLTAMFQLANQCVLVPTPCGCVTPSDEKFQEGFFECKWCGATFEAEAFAAWINNDSAPEIFLTQSPRSLLKWQGTLYEVEYEFMDMPVVRIGDDFIPVEQFEWAAN